MAENMMCPAHKASTPKSRKNYSQIKWDKPHKKVKGKPPEKKDELKEFLGE